MKWKKLDKPKNPKDSFNDPDEVGIYLICLRWNAEHLEPFYVGESKQINARLNKHRVQLRQGGETFLRSKIPDFPNHTWLRSILELRTQSPELEPKFVYIGESDESIRPKNFSDEVEEFWKRLEFFSIVGDLSEKASRQNLEATLQIAFTEWLTAGAAPLTSAERRVRIEQGTSSLFLGKRSGTYKPELLQNLGDIHQELKHLISVDPRGHRKAA